MNSSRVCIEVGCQEYFVVALICCLNFDFWDKIEYKENQYYSPFSVQHWGLETIFKIFLISDALNSVTFSLPKDLFLVQMELTILSNIAALGPI